MNSDRFKELLDELDGNSLQTLKEKSANYAKDGDCLHNFRSGAEIMGRTPAQACWGYMTKHLVALRDKVERDDFSDREDFLEKCQDIINYIRNLWCIGNDDKPTTKVEYGDIVIHRVSDDSVYRLFEAQTKPRIEIGNLCFLVHFYDDVGGDSVDSYPYSNYYYTLLNKKESK